MMIAEFFESAVAQFEVGAKLWIFLMKESKPGCIEFERDMLFEFMSFGD